MTVADVFVQVLDLLDEEEFVLLRELIEVQILHELVDDLVSFLQILLSEVLISFLLMQLIVIIVQHIHCARVLLLLRSVTIMMARLSFDYVVRRCITVLDIPNRDRRTQTLTPTFIITGNAHLARIIALIIPFIAHWRLVRAVCCDFGL